MKKNMTEDAILQVSDVLKAMADPMRLRILHSLHEGELSVTSIIESLGLLLLGAPLLRRKHYR